MSAASTDIESFCIYAYLYINVLLKREKDKREKNTQQPPTNDNLLANVQTMLTYTNIERERERRGRLDRKRTKINE